MDDMEREARKLLDLPEGWDTYKAARIESAAVERAVEAGRALREVAGDDPRFVPLPDGGVQVEWHAISSERRQAVLEEALRFSIPVRRGLPPLTRSRARLYAGWDDGGMDLEIEVGPFEGKP